MVLAVVAVVVGLYLFVTMYSATLERRREIATMRALGARRATMLGIVLLESCAIAVLGGLAGILGGHGVAYAGALPARGAGRAGHASVRAERAPAGCARRGHRPGSAGRPAARVLAYRTEVAENLAPL